VVIYNKLVIDMTTGDVIESESFDYDGPVAEAKGGPSSQSSSNPTYMIPSLIPDIEKGARYSITGPASGQEVSVPWYSISGENQPYSIPQTLTDINMNRAIHQIRGGYGARGLEGSGISQVGEEQAVGQIALQGQQQAATNLTNLLAAGTGQTSKATSGGGGGGMFGK